MSKPRTAGMVIRVVNATKLYWGMVAVVAAGAIVVPVAADGTNIFLGAANLTDVLRQVSITGIIAVGMTLVILSGGIDLSVGSVMAMGSTVAAMLLTQQGWHAGAIVAIPAATIVGGSVCFVVLSTLLTRQIRQASRRRAYVGVAAVVFAAGLAFWLNAQLSGGVGTVGVIIATMSLGFLIGAISGVIVARGGLQPFIATLAMMVTILGAARLTAGQDQSVYPVYTGSNAPASFEILRSSILGVPIPGLIFLAIVVIFAVLLARFRFGREIYAIGGNEKAALLAGVNVARVKIIVYALSGMLATLAGILYAAQYRQGKPDAGSGLELDAIAAVVIGGSSLMGGRGTIHGTLAGVLIFGFLSNIFQLSNIDSNTQLVLKGIIIVGAVMLQEGRAFRFSTLWRK